MKTIGEYKLAFPETQEEANNWKPFTMRRALASTALVVATTRIEGKWKAYAAGVPGMKHEHEQEDVLAYGDEIPEDVARVLFPYFEGVPYAR